jgi:hypothetical protein
MITHLSAPLLLVVALTSTGAAGPTIAIDAASPAGNVSRLFYGLMTEEINHAYDVPAHGIVVLTLETR